MSKQFGFTMIEMVAVIVVVAVLAATAVMRFPSTQSFQAEGFSGVFLHDLRLTSVLSMSQNQRYRIVIGSASYQIQNEQGTPITHPETGTSAISYPAGVTITPAMTLIFDSLGAPYNGNGVALSSTQSFAVTAGTLTKTVSVTPQTGLVQ